MKKIKQYREKMLNGESLMQLEWSLKASERPLRIDILSKADWLGKDMRMHWSFRKRPMR